MSFRVTVTEEAPAANLDVGQRANFVRFEQTVDMLDLPALFAAINRVPRVRRVRVKKVKD